MVVIITGASHTGKTLQAQKLLEKYQYPYLSIDHLKMGLIRSGYTDLAPEEDLALTEYLWPIVREIIKTAIENDQNLIVEGGYIPFDWKKDFEEIYLDEIQYYCLIMHTDYIERYFAQIKETASIIEKRLDDTWCTKEFLLKENAYYLQMCKKYGCNYVMIDYRQYPPCILRI